LGIGWGDVRAEGRGERRDRERSREMAVISRAPPVTDWRGAGGRRGRGNENVVD